MSTRYGELVLSCKDDRDLMKGSVSEETAKLGFSGSETPKFGISQVTLIEKDHLDCNHPDDLFQSRYATPGFK